MHANANRIFISYRREDAAGYAGRIEEALERQLGRGSVFRDVLDIPPGEDFMQAIRARLAGARTVLVLIGPRWAGADAAGGRRIDDVADFVRLEVALALTSGAMVVPVLLPGAVMPAEASLPEPLQALARRNAVSLGESNWDADMRRLAEQTGLSPTRALPTWAWGAAVAVVAVLVAWWVLRHDAAPGAVAAAPAAVAAASAAAASAPASAALPDASERWVGVWAAEVRYAWGDRYPERFEFKRHAGQMTGSASFLGYPRAIENLRIDGPNLHFETRSQATMGESTREVTRAYAVELRGAPPDEVLAFRMQSRGGHSSEAPIEFQARRLTPQPGDAPPRGR